MLSAGRPTLPHQFDWVYQAVKRDMMFASISGGTEIIGCFMIGSPIHPVRRGHLTVQGARPRRRSAGRSQRSGHRSPGRPGLH